MGLDTARNKWGGKLGSPTLLFKRYTCSRGTPDTGKRFSQPPIGDRCLREPRDSDHLEDTVASLSGTRDKNSRKIRLFF